nr:DNA polymerase [Pseudaminobacter soli]
MKEGDAAGVWCHFSADAPYCKVERKDFNPNSRPQIIDRLRVVYNWEPVDFTEAGNPQVDDEVLRKLADDWPICDTLAELFFLAKLHGQVAKGQNGWMKLVDEDGFIHARTNAGGTRSGRASHSFPNIAQVPKVKVVDLILKDGSKNNLLLDANGEWLPQCYKADGSLKKAAVVYGRAGNYGWECRNLFQAPVLNGHQWWLMGCDLSGIELRCFGHHLARWDEGSYLEVVLNGDVHTTNQQAAGLPTRDNAKTFIYATLYGGGDAKIGSIVCPPGTPEKIMAARGKELKAKFQQGVPAYRELMRWVAKQARQGWMPGLDGRKLWVKSPHSALNLLLQSDGALIAKKWVCLYVEYMEDAGYRFGWDGDFTLCAWVHDEIQSACRTKEIAEHAAEIAKRAAADAGHHFNYVAPVDAEAKIGLTWAQTH